MLIYLKNKSSFCYQNELFVTEKTVLVEISGIEPLTF